MRLKISFVSRWPLIFGSIRVQKKNECIQSETEKRVSNEVTMYHQHLLQNSPWNNYYFFVIWRYTRCAFHGAFGFGKKKRVDNNNDDNEYKPVSVKRKSTELSITRSYMCFFLLRFWCYYCLADESGGAHNNESGGIRHTYRNVARTMRSQQTYNHKYRVN